MNDFLRVENVVKDYPSGETTLRVLKGITLEIEPSKITAIWFGKWWYWGDYIGSCTGSKRIPSSNPEWRDHLDR